MKNDDMKNIKMGEYPRKMNEERSKQGSKVQNFGFVVPRPRHFLFTIDYLVGVWSRSVITEIRPGPPPL